MLADFKQYGLGVIGSGAFSHHFVERLLLRQDLQVVAAWFGSQASVPNLRQGCEVYSQPRAVIDSPRTEVVYFEEIPALDLLEYAIQRGKAVVLASTIGLPATQLLRLANLAATSDQIAIIDEPRRWDEDFLGAKAAFEAGQLGTLQRLRLAIHETSLPGETFSRGVLQELGCHWIDQLLVFARAEPESIQVRKFHGTLETPEVGFVATIDFKDGLSAVVEVQTTSLLSLRTGWLLEGTTGAYRAGRHYSRTPDGEIIDVPVTIAADSADPFLDNLVNAMAGDQTALSNLSTLSHAARTSAMIELLENATDID